MLDLRWVVANLDEARRRLAARGAAASEALAPIEALAAERRQLIQSSERQRAEQRRASEQMRTLKGEEQAQLRARLKVLSDDVKEKEARLKTVEERIEQALLNVPNLPHETVPVGASERDNQVVRIWGDKPEIASPKEHTEIGERLGLLDFQRAAKVSGARFAFYRGALARLELALVQFFLDSARERGYLDLLPPYLVNADSMRGTGQLPKFEEDLFKTTAGYYLIPTAEVPVTNYHRDEILEGARLPLKCCAFSPCFRSEAGSYGKDTKGLIRQHQFHKVELVRFEKPRRRWRSWGCTTACRFSAPPTWASPQRRPTTWKSGCRARTRIARSAPAPRSGSSRRGGRRSGSGQGTPTNRAWWRRSTAAGSPWGAPWWPCSRTASKPTAASSCPRRSALTWVGSSG